MCLRFSIVLCMLLFGGLSLSQAAEVGSLYKWTDDDGKVHYSDTPPPTAANQEREVLNKQGVTVKVLAAEKTPEQLAAEQRQREQARLAAEQAALDHALMNTYTSVTDIERARDNRLQAIEAQIRVVNGNIGNIEERLIKLEHRAAALKAKKGIPPYVATQLEETRVQLLQNQRYLLKRRAEKDDIRHKYAEDIARFKTLKTKK